ncbi:hypothetical protein [Georgenia faecalis]|uniref:YgjV family protein n=2 Tax=Georgenia faecalis TaxID=2483799 RepID=A0ABV9DDT9_9MICO|nr:hypothetical protein [Georgenia faecalis]
MQTALEVVGWLGSAIVVWSMMQQRIVRLRVYNLIGCVVQVFYNGVLGVWPVVALNVVLAAVQVINLTRLLRYRHSDRTYDVIETEADGGYLAHLLEVHRADIATYHPGFHGVPPGSQAYLVVTGDETVGYVILRDAGDRVAQIELDYVTERYRDFTPGEFVFRRSGVLPKAGYRRVVTAPGTVEPYYPKIGFQRVGDAYELELAPA